MYRSHMRRRLTGTNWFGAAVLFTVVVAAASSCGSKTGTTPVSGAGGGGGSSTSGGSGGGGGTAGSPLDAGVGSPDAPTTGDTATTLPDASTAIDVAMTDATPPPYDAAAGPITRANLDFNIDWKFRQGDVAGADAKAFVDTAWTYVDVPHTPKFVTPEDPFAYAGISWYRKHFTVAGAYQGGKIFIEFGGAMQLADVWVNGVHKTQHQGGYAPFTVDVTGDVSYGGADNVIAVKLDSSPNPLWAPGRTGVDFQYNGGLYRDVIMHVTNPLHVTDAVFANKVAGGGVFVTYPAATTTSATVNIKTNVINESAAAKSTTLVSTLLDATGASVGSATATSMIAAGANADFTQSIVVANPHLWHPNTPYLYTVRTTVQDGAIAVDESTTHAGIRRIQWSRAGGLVINGTRWRALGVNLLEETYGLGNAIPDQSIYYDVKRIRDAGLTFIRGSHYPHAPAFYDACDALGVLVMDAQTGWQFFSAATAFVNFTYQELRDMMRRDRNHPSVVAWEANLNESAFTDAWAQMANTIVHAEYPGDQAFSAAWPATGNFFADIYIDASQHNIRATTQTRPIVIDEYGDWDYGGVASTTRQPREGGDTAMLRQVVNVQDGQNLNQAVPWFSADGYWEYADYGGYGGITRSGLLDMYRLPKFAYYFMQSQRDPNVTVAGVDSGPMVYIANQWTTTSPTSVSVYSNCTQVSLFLNGTLVATRSPDTGAAAANLVHPPFTFAVGAFAAGTLRADCLIAGVQRATVTRQTPGAATSLRLRPEGTTLLGNQSDARLVFIDAVDSAGTVVPGNASQVTLSVTGPGSIVGPTVVTLKGGQLAAWVRAGRAAGTLSVTASATGLTAGSVDLTVQAVAGLPTRPVDRP